MAYVSLHPTWRIRQASKFVELTNRFKGPLLLVRHVKE